jgi:hypothetical protein
MVAMTHMGTKAQIVDAVAMTEIVNMVDHDDHG